MGSIVLAGATTGSTTITPTDNVTITCTLPSTGGTIQTSGAGFTTNGVAYASSTSALTTGSALKFDGATLGVGITPSAWYSGVQAIQFGTAGAVWSSNDRANLTSNLYLDASTNFKYINTGYALRYAQESGTHYWQIAASGTAGNTISFTQAMTLDSSGRLLVGTTSAIDGETRLGAINSTSASAVAKFRNSHNTSGDETFGLTVGPNCQNTSSYLLTGGVYGVANVFFIYGNGNVVNTNNSYGSLSDVKLKENIVDATPKLADLMQVKVRNYNLKSDPNHKQLGVIAQELETVFPAMIDESPDKDEEGNVLETTTKSVKYSVFVPMLIKSIQELSTLITAQSATITSLTERITALEGART